LKTRPTEAELLDADGRTDGRTDMPKLTIAFLNFANAPEMKCFLEVNYKYCYWNAVAFMKKVSLKALSIYWLG